LQLWIKQLEEKMERIAKRVGERMEGKLGGLEADKL
jgi:hypothetical protein